MSEIKAVARQQYLEANLALQEKLRWHKEQKDWHLRRCLQVRNGSAGSVSWHRSQFRWHRNRSKILWDEYAASPPPTISQYQRTIVRLTVQ